jgi:hypothetical protein
MIPFPLYIQLTSEFTIKNPNDNDRNLFIERVKKIPKHYHEIIYAIIRTHQILNNKSSVCILPYNAKRQKRGIKFDFDKLPLELQCILLKYIKKIDL